VRQKRGGKLLGGEPPRRRGRGGRREKRSGSTPGTLAVLAVALFVLGGVAGFAWSLDRQLRGGVLRQWGEASGRPDWVELEQLPGYVPTAFLAVVDPAYLEAGSLRTGENGTTLARELVRQVHLVPASLGGEARELVMGPVLEHRTPKRGLLELYLNRVYLGREQGYPVFGLHHAAREYFDKAPEQLTLGETATLAGLLLSPRIDNPAAHAGAVGARRNEVLRVLRVGELITDAQYRSAVAEPLGFQPGLDELPMSRPADWGRAETIRLPENLRPWPDSLAADSAAA
jgi:membrane peptidoglycan carboxypeptidase